jgi:hypothetical protein
MLANLKPPVEVMGVLVDNLGLSQIAFTTATAIHRYIHEHGEWDISVFIKDLEAHCTPCNFSIMQLYNGYGFNGTLVATNLDLANKLISFPGQKRKVFYMWDMEWFRRPISHNLLNDIYNNPILDIVCRSDEHAKYFESAWGRKVKGVVPNFNIKELIGVIHG